MGTSDKVKTTSEKNVYGEDLKKLQAKKSRILSRIGEKYVSQHRGKDMTGTEYEELFGQLSEVERQIEDILEEKTDEALDGPSEEKLLRQRIIFSCVLLFMLVCLGVAIALVGQSTKPRVVKAPATEQTGDPAKEPETPVQEVVISREEQRSAFAIAPDNVADYGNVQVLTPGKYVQYQSEIEGFSFGYPSDIFNDVDVVELKENGAYGRIARQITFSASDGARAVFTVYDNLTAAQGSNIEVITREVLNAEKASLFTPVMKSYGVSGENGYGTVILTAYADSSANADCVYDLCRVGADRILQMKLIYPRPINEEEDRQKAFYVNTMYNLCGFGTAGVKEPESYKAFVAEKYTEFTLSGSQKRIFWDIMDNMVTSRKTYEANRMQVTVPVGSTKEIAGKLSEDRLLLQMYLQAGLSKDSDNIDSEVYACAVDYGKSGSTLFYRKELGESEFEQYRSRAYGEKSVLSGSLDYARTFYRDMFDLELDTGRLKQDNQAVIPGEFAYLLYSRDYDDLVYLTGTGVKSRVDGPDDWDYNSELDCFDYHMGPVYELTEPTDTWEQKRDAIDPGNGIYVVHLRPYSNNSLGFRILGIERVE